MWRKYVLYGLVEMIIIINCCLCFNWYKFNCFYEVIFAENGVILEKVEVKKKNKVNVPKSLKKDGYEVKYYLGDDEYNLDSIVTRNIVIDVKYTKIEEETETTPDSKSDEKEKYTVTFDTKGGSTIEAIEVEKDATVTLPSNPTKEGFEFVEWQLNGKTFNSKDKINGNITLVAIWKKVTKPDSNQNSNQNTTPKPVVKNYTFKVVRVDAYSPDAYITVYENGSPRTIKEAFFGSDGVQIIGAINGTTMTVNYDEINAESTIKVKLYDGSTIIATRS